MLKAKFPTGGAAHVITRTFAKYADERKSGFYFGKDERKVKRKDELKATYL